MSFDLRARRTTFGYGIPTTAYRKGYHRGLDKGADGGEQAQWLSSGVVTQITRNANIGTWVETTNELGVGGTFIGYGHTHAPDGLRVGDRVTAGADGPIVNGWDDDHGTDWDGPHVHVWTGDVSGDMGVALGNDLDPAPIFAATPSSATEGDDMKLIYNLENDHGAIIGGAAGGVDIGKVSARPPGWWDYNQKVHGAAQQLTDTEFMYALQGAQLTATGSRSSSFPTADEIAAKVKVPAPAAMTPAAIASLATKIAAAVAAKLPKKLTGTLS